MYIYLLFNTFIYWYLILQSSHFGNFEKNRGGFEKLYRKLSDQTWEKAIDLVKFMGKRGAHMTFRYSKDEVKDKAFKPEELAIKVFNSFIQL